MPAAGYDPDQSSAEHPLAKLVIEGGGWILVLCFVSAVIVAPLVEEFLFRVLLQGWLEALEHRWRRQMPTLRRLVPRAFLAIFVVSVLFAVMHFRVAGPPVETRTTAILLASNALASLLTTAFALGWMRWHVRATAADLGWSPENLWGDLWLGLGGLAAVAAPLYATQIALNSLLPPTVAPDPIPLFFLAVALGTLYYRTHRILPSLVVHAGLNAVSMVLAFWGG